MVLSWLFVALITAGQPPNTQAAPCTAFGTLTKEDAAVTVLSPPNLPVGVTDVTLVRSSPLNTPVAVALRFCNLGPDPATDVSASIFVFNADGKLMVEAIPSYAQPLPAGGSTTVLLTKIADPRGRPDWRVVVVFKQFRTKGTEWKDAEALEHAKDRLGIAR